jgi:glutaredoxin-like YruB-family protein
MKNLVSLILVIGLVVAGWMNRDKFGGLWTQASTTLAEASSNLGLPNVARATPHPAREAQARATALYPGLARANSALNRKFIALYKEAQSTDPALLSDPEWPLRLAERAIVSLGGAPRAAPSAAVVRASQPVVVYTTSHCPYCTKAKQYLMQKGIRFREIDIEQSSMGKEAYRKLGGSGVPLIMVGNTKVQGFDRNQLDRLLL